MGFYSIFKRPTKKGIIYYYRVHYPDGTRSVGHSTHQKTKSKANDFCQQLIQEGRLWAGSESTFQAYIELNHWFTWGECAFLKDRLANSTKDKPGITRSSADKYAKDLGLYLLPYFDPMKLKK